jgi:oligoendopeptidase F
MFKRSLLTLIAISVGVIIVPSNLRGESFSPSIPRFEHPTFDHSSFENLNNTFQNQTSRFSTDNLRHDSSFRSDPDFSNAKSSFDTFNTDQFHQATQDFETVAGNSDRRFENNDDRFSNMRMEFSDPNFQNRNFNVR